MGKLFSFRYALLLSILLFSISSYCFVREYIYAHEADDFSLIQEHLSEDAMTVDNVNSEYDMTDTATSSVIDSSLVLNPPPIHNDKTLNVLGTTISLGESTESIQDKLGNPNRIAKTEMDFDYYVYSNNYSKLLFIAIKDNQVAGYYTDSIDFNYLGIAPGSGLEEVNEALHTDMTMNYLLTHVLEDYSLHIFMDEIGTHGVTGLLLIRNDVKRVAYTDEALRDMELLIYDLTNSIRKRNDVPILSWSSTAAGAARKHSTDMAKNRYFNHYSLYNESPGDRLKEEGIIYKSIGENIIAGYENAIISSHAWFNSPDHRDNILNENYTSLGVGFTYLEDSIYKSYITQNFFR